MHCIFSHCHELFHTGFSCTEVFNSHGRWGYPILEVFGSTDPWFISRSLDLPLPDLRIYVYVMHLIFEIPRRHCMVESLFDMIVAILWKVQGSQSHHERLTEPDATLFERVPPSSCTTLLQVYRQRRTVEGSVSRVASGWIYELPIHVSNTVSGLMRMVSQDTF